VNSSELSAWRKNERTRLLREREALTQRPWASCARGSTITLNARSGSGARNPDILLAVHERIRPAPSGCGLARRGGRTALPVVVAPKTPLVFANGNRDRAANGPLGIPTRRLARGQSGSCAPAHAGWDGDGYRLGYGGGFFDRTLAALTAAARHRHRLRAGLP